MSESVEAWEDPECSAMSHLEREQRAQWAMRAARLLDLPTLRLVRAKLADSLQELETPYAIEVAQLRGSIVHSEIERRAKQGESLGSRKSHVARTGLKSKVAKKILDLSKFV